MRANIRRCRSVVLALAMCLSASATPASSVSSAAPQPCPGFGAYGYVEHRAGISCARAKSVAAAAVRARVVSDATDCTSARHRRFRSWRIYGPYRGGLVYRYTRAGVSFTTDKPTECSIPASEAARTPNAVAATGVRCGTVKVPFGDGAYIRLRVTRYRMGRPDDSLSCARARSIIRHNGNGYFGWVCVNPHGLTDLKCTTGNRVGWRVLGHDVST